MTTEPTQAAVVLRDRELGRLVRDLRPDPPDQARLFRGRLISSDASCYLKVGPGELEAVWMPAISARAVDIVARVLATGTFAENNQQWLLLEDLPLRARSDRLEDVLGVMRCAARFQQVAADVSLPTYPIDAEFVTTYTRKAIEADCPGAAAAVLTRIDADDQWLRSWGGHTIGHGDVHFWNAVSATTAGPWRLIDPIPRNAHWAWDAAYAQLTSGVPETPDLIAVLADQRHRLGLPIEDAERIDQIRTQLLGWSSLLWWALLPARRYEPWWRSEVERNVDALATLRH
ncbi:hypothetical protein FOE78_18385 [Microlunatus elymi]|uniref:Phosphotransferase enzyme family protein n=1 Tax=Microlunatus elymi TaxID=2596828 RepID=A0A516Q2E8_9ACTN|nr:hypothetical protein [Microlunatus elymi]QDP97615.1 hypothetical protein FOE78_18385 [Microlunatus elymi]